MKLVAHRAAEKGDLVFGQLAKIGVKHRRYDGAAHYSIVNHRYGHSRELIYAESLCGRSGRVGRSSGGGIVLCKVCERAANRPES